MTETTLIPIPAQTNKSLKCIPRGLCTTLLFCYLVSLFVFFLYVYRFLSPSSFTYLFPSVVLSTALPTISARLCYKLLPFLLKPVATFGRCRHYDSRLHNVFLTDSTPVHAVANRDTGHVQYTDQEMTPPRNAMNVVTIAEVMFVTIQRENILPSNITD
jgi:hypothetical protein